MRVLILGGTKFLGVHITGALLARGHEVTHFNRGRTGTSPSGVRTVHGDRERGFGVLEGERFDAVVDTSGYFPHVVEASARFFESRADRYVFISTVSVYPDSDPAPHEDGAVKTLPDGASRTEMPPDFETYGALKALCEAVVVSTFRSRSTILRPGLIVGPLDPTDRFTYWPVRFARGGNVLLPGPPERPVQFVDARDLAAFAALTIERGLGGTFNATSPRGTFTMRGVEEACARVARMPYVAHYASDEFLSAHGVAPWMGLPLWLPASEGVPGLANADVTRATTEGLTIRELAATARDTLVWGAGREGAHWLAREREAELVTVLAAGRAPVSTTS